jgi:hypothetical protein
MLKRRIEPRKAPFLCTPRCPLRRRARRIRASARTLVALRTTRKKNAAFVRNLRECRPTTSEEAYPILDLAFFWRTNKPPAIRGEINLRRPELFERRERKRRIPVAATVLALLCLRLRQCYRFPASMDENSRQRVRLLPRILNDTRKHVREQRHAQKIRPRSSMLATIRTLTPLI